MADGPVRLVQAALKRVGGLAGCGEPSLEVLQPFLQRRAPEVGFQAAGCSQPVDAALEEFEQLRQFMGAARQAAQKLYHILFQKVMAL
ncbi:hypothetical protein OG729_00590 [Streptomyces sp. NBC_00210]|uniref:hypothetical protein n=1 Tax=unclassified Streptomyces TaxID=2593676 RepID=UPI00324A0D44